MSNGSSDGLDALYDSAAKQNYPDEPYDMQNLVFFGAFFLGLATLMKILEPIWGDFIREKNAPTILGLHSSVMVQFFSVLLGSIGLAWTPLGEFLEYEINPVIIYHFFIPILVFHAAFCSEDDIYGGTITQVINFILPTIALTLIFSTLASFLIPEIKAIDDTSILVVVCVICGTIMATTSPEATIGIMKQLGDTRNIGSILEAESMIVNSVAFLLFETLMEILDMNLNKGREVTVLSVITVVLLYTVASFLFGWFAARVASCYLSNIYHDSISEITITISSIFLLNYTATNLNLSGVLTIGTYGIFLKKWQHTYQDVEFLNKFWGILNFLSRTLIYVIAGLVVTKFFKTLTFLDVAWAAYLWAVLLVVRFVSLIIVTSLVNTNGVLETSVKNVFILSWGGLKGAIGLSIGLYLNQLALFIRWQWTENGGELKDISPRDNNILMAFDKVMLYNAFQVFLTMIINANSVECLANVLGMLSVTETQQNAMRYVVSFLAKFREDSLFVLQNDNFHCNAHWNIVRKMTKISNPYEKYQAKVHNSDDEDSDVDEDSGADDDEETNFQRFQENNKTDKYKSQEEYSFDMSRQRVIKSLKLTFGKNYENGFMHDAETRVLIAAADEAQQKRGVFVHPDMLRKNWEISPKMSKAQKKIDGFYVRFCSNRKYQVDKRWKFQVAMLDIVSSDLFQATVEFFVVINIFALIYTFLLNTDRADTSTLGIFIIFDLFFVLVYVTEIVFKVIAYGPAQFVKYWENSVLLLIASCSTIDILHIILEGRSNKINGVRVIMLILRNLRIIRFLYVIVKYGCVITLEILNAKVRKAYNVGKGFIKAEGELVNDTNSVINDEKVKRFLAMKFRSDHIQVQQELGSLQQDHNRIILSIKTTNAIRHILNKLVELITDMRSAGILDHNEQEILIQILQAKQKRVSNFQSSLDPTTPEQFLSNIEWIKSSPDLVQFMLLHSKEIDLPLNSILMVEGAPQDGIYIIISGLVEVVDKNVSELLKMRSKGQLDQQKGIGHTAADPGNPRRIVMGCGDVLGEIGVLTNAPRTATIISVTNAKVMHIDEYAAAEAMIKFPAEKEKLWKIIAGRMLLSQFMKIKFYKDFNQNDVMMHIRAGDLVYLVKDAKEEFKMKEEIDELSIVYGAVDLVDDEGEETPFIGPSIIPFSPGTLKLQYSNELNIAVLIQTQRLKPNSM